MKNENEPSRRGSSGPPLLPELHLDTGHLLLGDAHFIVIHTVKGFGIVNKAEIDVFWMGRTIPVQTSASSNKASVMAKGEKSCYKYF